MAYLWQGMNFESWADFVSYLVGRSGGEITVSEVLDGINKGTLFGAPVTQISNVTGDVIDVLATPMETTAAAGLTGGVTGSYAPVVATTAEVTETGTAVGTASAGAMGVLSTSLPLAFAAVAPALGVGVGVALYESNPTLWTNISKTLLPFCYDDGTVPTLVDSSGNTYYSDDFINGVKNSLIDNNAYVQGNPTIPTDNPLNVPSFTYCTYSGSGRFSSGAYDFTVNNAKTIWTTASDGQQRILLASADSGFLGSSYTPRTYTYNGKTVYYNEDSIYFHTFLNPTPSTDAYIAYADYFNISAQYAAWLMIYGGYIGATGITGYTPQTGATYPNATDPISKTYPDWGKTNLITDKDGNTKPYHKVTQSPSDSTNTTPQGTSQTGTNTDPDILTRIIEGIKDITDTITQTIPSIIPSDPTTTDTGDTPTITPPLVSAASDTGMIAIYNPTAAILKSFAAWLWSTNFIDQLQKFFQSPNDAIIGLHILYATPIDNGSKNIVAGYLDSGVSSPIVGNQYTTIDCGTINVPEYFGNALDYSPYTSVHVYLPFIGFVDIRADDVIGGTLNITYRIDVLTGACMAMLTINRNDANAMQYSYGGNCAIQIPTSGGSYNAVVNTIVGAAAGAAIGAITGGLGGAISGGMLGGSRSLIATKPNVMHSGGYSANAGACGPRKPFIIIERVQPYTALEFNQLYGFPANSRTLLSACSGFTRVAHAFIDIPAATDEEKAEISALLKEGVIL